MNKEMFDLKFPTSRNQLLLYSISCTLVVNLCKKLSLNFSLLDFGSFLVIKNIPGIFQGGYILRGISWFFFHRQLSLVQTLQLNLFRS